MFYPRLLYSQLKDHLREKEITVITGGRRTGKTALLAKLFEEEKTGNKAFIDLENRINRELFQIPDYEEVIRNLQQKYQLAPQKPMYIFLDEIQYLPHLPSLLKYLFDHYQTKFVVTGSSSFYLKNLFSETLAGRKRIFELYPLTFDEFLLFRGKLPQLTEEKFSLSSLKKSDWWQKAHESDFTEYLRWGGFPQVVLAQNTEEKTQILKEVLYSYIEQDVKNLSQFRKIADLEKIIRLLAGRIGQKLDVAKISREISLSRQTILEYLGFLEQTYVIAQVSPFSRNIDREISKTPKIYFCDTGLANVLSPISQGQMLENAAYHLLRVKYPVSSLFSPLNYYQKKSGAEIDFILDKKIAVEVKEFASPSDYRRLESLAESLRLKEWYLVSQKLTATPQTLYASQLF